MQEGQLFLPAVSGSGKFCILVRRRIQSQLVHSTYRKFFHSSPTRVHHYCVAELLLLQMHKYPSTLTFYGKSLILLPRANIWYPPSHLDILLSESFYQGTKWRQRWLLLHHHICDEPNRFGAYSWGWVNFFTLLWRPRFVARIHLKTFWSNGMKKNDFLGPLSAFKVF